MHVHTSDATNLLQLSARTNTCKCVYVLARMDVTYIHIYVHLTYIHACIHTHTHTHTFRLLFCATMPDFFRSSARTLMQPSACINKL